MGIKHLRYLSKLAIICMLFIDLTGCQKNNEIADVIVYGDNIYTANDDNKFVNAFAIKDGKYIAVGSKDDVDKYKSESTKIYNASFVMPGATEAHGHFILEQAFKLGCYIEPLKENGEAKNLDEIVEELVIYANNNDVSDGIYAYQFNSSINCNLLEGIIPIKEMLDEKFKDIQVFVAESSLHGAWVNSKCLEIAGLLENDTDTIHIDRYKNGEAIGILRDEACVYVRNQIFGSLLEHEKYKLAIKNAVTYLNSLGYTAHYDMWSNFDGTDEMYKSIYELDSENALTCLFGSAYSIESYEKDNFSEGIAKAVELKNKYISTHFKPSWLKLFADGVIEANTGYVKEPYAFDPQSFGTQIWDDETMNSIVNEANENGLLVHIHTMGDAAVSEALDAFIDSMSHNGYYRNSLGHVGLIGNDDLLRVKENNIGIASGANWASQVTQTQIEASREGIGEERFIKMYPYEEYVQYGINAALSTDNPCSPGILDVFGYIQVLINGYDHKYPVNEDTFPKRNTFISVEDALKMFTYNGAWMNNLENERDSIEVGKYADFVFADKDPFKENIDDIWKINVENTFFEGKIVYSKFE